MLLPAPASSITVRTLEDTKLALNDTVWSFGSPTFNPPNVVDIVSERTTRFVARQSVEKADRLVRRQTCLAHLARDVAYGLEASEDPIPFRLKLWFDRVFAFAVDLAGMAQSTLRAKKRELERQIDDILMASPSCSIAKELIGKIARARDQLLVFCSFPGGVETTNNGSERALRPAVIQRKVTNGYRAMWAAEYETAVRSAVDTPRLAGAGPFQTVLQTSA